MAAKKKGQRMSRNQMRKSAQRLADLRTTSLKKKPKQPPPGVASLTKNHLQLLQTLPSQQMGPPSQTRKRSLTRKPPKMKPSRANHSITLLTGGRKTSSATRRSSTMLWRICASTSSSWFSLWPRLRKSRHSPLKSRTPTKRTCRSCKTYHCNRTHCFKSSPQSKMSLMACFLSWLAGLLQARTTGEGSNKC